MSNTIATCFLVSGCCLLFASACNDDGTAGASDAGSEDAQSDLHGEETGSTDTGSDVLTGDQGGPALWIVESADSQAGAEFAGGELRLTDRSTASGFTCSTVPCEPIKVYQMDLTGDFVAAVSVAEFATDDPFGRLCFYVVEQSEAAELARACFFGDLGAITATPSGQISIPIDGVPEALHIARTGTTISVTVETTAASRSREDSYGGGPLSIGVFLENASGAEASAAFADFTISGGQGAVSDDFDR